MKQAIFSILLFVVLFVAGFFLATSLNNVQTGLKRTQIIMGAPVEIILRENSSDAEIAVTAAFEEIRRIDKKFSSHIEGSPVYNINNSNDTVFNIDDEFYSLLLVCDSLNRISNGAFDAGINELIKVWGFDDKSPLLPAKDVLTKHLNKSGWKNISLDGKNIFVRHSCIGLNFGAVAKGFAVERAVKVLNDHGFNDLMVNAGGDIKTSGDGWMIGVKHPRIERRIIHKLNLNDMSVATSGDYEQFFEVNGVRYHHIIDPLSGYPARGIQSVTVIHKDNAFADGLATAVFVLGKIKGLNLIESLENTETMIIDEQGNITYSTGFSKYIIN